MGVKEPCKHNCRFKWTLQSTCDPIRHKCCKIIYGNAPLPLNASGPVGPMNHSAAPESSDKAMELPPPFNLMTPDKKARSHAFEQLLQGLSPEERRTLMDGVSSPVPQPSRFDYSHDNLLYGDGTEQGQGSNQLLEIARIFANSSNASATQKLSLRSVTVLPPSAEPHLVAHFFHQCGNLCTPDEDNYALCFSCFQTRCQAQNFKHLCIRHVGHNTLAHWVSFVQTSLNTLYDGNFMEHLSESWKSMLTMGPSETVAIYDARTSHLLHSAVSVAQWLGESMSGVEYKFVRKWIQGLPRDIRMAVTGSLRRTSTFFEVQRTAREISSVASDSPVENAAKVEILKRKLELLESKKHGDRDNSKRNKDISLVALAQRMEDIDRNTTTAARAQTDRIEDLNRAVCYVGEQGRMNAGGAFQNQRARTMHSGQQERKTMGQPGLCFNFAKGHCPRGTLCGYRHDNNHASIGAPPSMPAAAAAAAPPNVPPFFKPSPPSTPFPGMQGGSQMTLRARPNLPPDACIDHSRGECLRAVCKFKHYPK